jgi:hypothetical protein
MVESAKIGKQKVNNRSLNFTATSLESLSGNVAHQFAAQRALRIYRSQAIYTYIPKNACSTMRLSLAIENGCIENAAGYSWIHANNNTFVADLASLITARYTFVIIRCPFARLASAYLDKIVGKEPAGLQFAQLIEKSSVDGVSFDTFVRAMQKSNIRGANPHWRPQHDFLVYKRYDDYFCFEELKDAISKIQIETGMVVYDARKHTKHGLDHLNMMIEGKHENVTASEIFSMKVSGKCPHPRTLYNDELIDIVKSAYHLDYELYLSHFGPKGLMF